MKIAGDSGVGQMRYGVTSRPCWRTRTSLSNTYSEEAQNHV